MNHITHYRLELLGDSAALRQKRAHVIRSFGAMAKNVFLLISLSDFKSASSEMHEFAWFGELKIVKYPQPQAHFRKHHVSNGICIVFEYL